MNSPFFVGITGGSGSGKTHFLQSLKKHFSDEEMCVVTQDNYYYKRSLQPKDPKGIENFDTPQSIDSDRFSLININNSWHFFQLGYKDVEKDSIDILAYWVIVYS